MSTYFITGASRGLGLELVKQLIALPASQVSKIYASTRSDAASLASLSKTFNGRVVPVKLDVTDSASISQAAEKVEQDLQGKGIDVLVNNAGVSTVTHGGVQNMDELSSTFTTNVLGTHLVTRAFLPALRRGSCKKIVNISSVVGSITMAPYLRQLPVPAYKISKTALNALTVQYALDLEEEGFMVFALSPGWLRTDLGGSEADLSVEQGAKASLDEIMSAGKEQNGRFLNIKIEGWVPGASGTRYDGGDAPW